MGTDYVLVGPFYREAQPITAVANVGVAYIDQQSNALIDPQGNMVVAR
jgi:hypothetical protein